MKESSSLKDLISLLKHSKNFFSSQLYFAVLNLISIPIFSRLYSAEEYGVLSVYTTYSVIIAILLSLNSYRAVGRYYYEEKDDFGEFMGTLLIYCFGVYLALNFIFFLSLPWTGKFLKLGLVLPFLLSISGLNYISENIYNQFIIAKKKSREYSIIQITKNTITTFLSIYFVYILSNEKYYGQILTTIAVGLGLLLYSFFKLKKIVTLKFNRHHLRYITRYTLPLLPYTLGSFILSRFDRVIIAGLLGLSDAGVYTMGYNIGNLLLMVITAVDAAFVPNFYKYVNAKQFESLNKLIMNSMKISFIAALGLSLLKTEIFQILVSPKFSGGIIVVDLVIIADVFWAIFLFSKSYIDYHKHTYALSIIALVTGGANIALNIILIPIYGIYGGGIATLIAFILLAIISYAYLLARSEIQLFEVGGILFYALFLIVSIIGLNYFKISYLGLSLQNLIVKSIVVVTFTIIIYLKESKHVLGRLLS